MVAVWWEESVVGRRSTVGFFREIGWGSMRNEGMEWCDAEETIDDLLDDNDSGRAPPAVG